MNKTTWRINREKNKKFAYNKLLTTIVIFIAVGLMVYIEMRGYHVITV